MRVLMAELDNDSALGMARWLRATSMTVQRCTTASEMLDYLRSYAYGLVIIAAGSDERTLSAMVRDVRLARVPTPVLVVTSSALAEMKADALEAGADDVLTLPIHRDEFVARVRAIVRRANGHADTVLRAGSLEVRLGAREARVNGKRIRLTAMEFSVLQLLMLRRGMVLSREAFLNHLYGGVDEPEAKVIGVFMCNLRRKLAACGDHPEIETIRGEGYVLREPSAPPHDVGLPFGVAGAGKEGSRVPN